MVLWKLDAPETWDVRGVRSDWMGGGYPLLEVKGKRDLAGGATFEM